MRTEFLRDNFIAIGGLSMFWEQKIEKRKKKVLGLAYSDVW